MKHRDPYAPPPEGAHLVAFALVVLVIAVLLSAVA